MSRGVGTPEGQGGGAAFSKGTYNHTCQLFRFRRETPDFEDFFRLPDLDKKSPDITI